MLIHYPDIKPYSRHRLEVEPPHQLYVEESGNPEGIPVVFIHGGPGQGCESKNRCYFDPEKYRIILYDQRGAGRSKPHNALQGNHTLALVEDLEAIRQFLQIEQWILFGDGWGACLGMLYAEKHTESVLGMIIRGAFLGRQNEIDWLFKNGVNAIFPDYWEEFIKQIPKNERNNIVASYDKRLSGDNELVRMSAAKAWALWAARCSTLRPNHHIIEQFSDPHYALSMARLSAYYSVNQFFLEQDQVLDAVKSLRDIPCIIIHGRYDLIAPLETAYSIHQIWPLAQLHIVRDAGHDACEPSLVDAVVRATRTMAKRFDDSVA